MKQPGGGGPTCGGCLHPPKRSRSIERFFAWAWGHAGGTLEHYYGGLKRELFADIRGDVLEIGPGAGINLLHLPKDIRYTGIEPNPFMHPLLHAAAQERGMAIEIAEGIAEALPMADNSVDAVVSTLVLCSVFEQARVLAEVRRVLRPGGRFYFLEHVAAPRGSGLRRVQNVLAPLWRRVGDGCYPNRETWRALEAAGFSALQCEHRSIKVPLFPVTPHILGFATK